MILRQNKQFRDVTFYLGLVTLTLFIIFLSFQSFDRFYKSNHLIKRRIMSEYYVLWRTRLSIAVSLVFWRFAVWVTVVVLYH